MQIKNTAKLLYQHNILKYYHGEKSIPQNQYSFTIYVDFETVLENVDSFNKNKKKSFHIFYIHHLNDFQFQSNTNIMSQNIKTFLHRF